MSKTILKLIGCLCLVILVTNCKSENSDSSSSKQDPVKLQFNVSDFDSYGILVDNTIHAKITSKNEIKPDQQLYVAVTSDDTAVAHPHLESCILTTQTQFCDVLVTGITPGSARITFKSDTQTIVSNIINVTAESHAISFQGFSDTTIMPTKTVNGSLGFPKGAKIYTDYDVTLSSKKQLVDFTIDGATTNICKLNSKKLTCAMTVTAKNTAGEDTITAKSQYDNLKAEIYFSISPVPILSIKGFEDGNIIAKQAKSGTFGFPDGTILAKPIKIKLSSSSPTISISPSEYTLTTQKPNYPVTITAGDKPNKAVITVEAEDLGQKVEQEIFINLVTYFKYKQLTQAEKDCFKNFDHPDNNLYITAAINNNGISVQNLYKKEGNSCIAEPKVNELGTEIAISNKFYSLSDISNNNIIVGTSVLDDKKFSYAAFSSFNKPDTFQSVDVQYFDDSLSGKSNHPVAISNDGKYIVSDMGATYQKSDEIYQTIIADDLSSYDSILDPFYSMNVVFDYAHSYISNSGFGIANNGNHFINVDEIVGQGAYSVNNIYLCNLQNCTKFIDNYNTDKIKQTFDMSPSGEYLYKCKSSAQGATPYHLLSINPTTFIETEITISDSKFMCSEILKVFNNGSILMTGGSSQDQYIYRPASANTGTVSKVSELITRMNLPDVVWPNSDYNISRVSEDGQSFVLVNQSSDFDDTKSVEITVNNYNKPVWKI